MAVWKRKGAAARDASSSVLQRLEWFDRPGVAEPAPAADEPREPAAVTLPGAARPSEWLLPVPPWQAEQSQQAPQAVLEPEPAAPEPLELPQEQPVQRLPEPKPAPPAARPRGKRLKTVSAGLLTVAVSAGIILGASALRSDDSGQTVAQTKTPKQAALVVPARKPAVRHAAPAKPKPKPKPHPKPRAAAPSAPAPRTPTKLPPFAWSPVAGATAYDFQLFRGPKLVYSARTHRPGITVPAIWSSHGRLVRLGPGSYRWYVWAVVGGKRRDRAVVQATLDV